MCKLSSRIQQTQHLSSYPKVIQTKKIVSAVLAAYAPCFPTIILLEWQFLFCIFILKIRGIGLYGVDEQMVMGFREDNPAVMFLAIITSRKICLIL